MAEMLNDVLNRCVRRLRLSVGRNRSIRQGAAARPIDDTDVRTLNSTLGN